MGEPRLVKYRGKWAVQEGHGADRRRRSLGTDDRHQAERLFSEAKRIASVRNFQRPQTVGEIYESYSADRGFPERIRFAWKRLRMDFESIAPSRITKELVQDYTRRRRKAVGDGTIHTELGYLRAALAFAVREGWLVKAPYIPLPRKPPPRDFRLEMPEVRRLVGFADTAHTRLFITLAISTAGRAGAILDLTWDRVDFERRKIVLANPERGDTNKGRATVPMNDAAFLALRDAFEARTINHVIEWAGKPVVSIKKGMRTAARRAGLKCSPHVLRHSAACIMAESRVPMTEIAQYLGHSDVRTTYRIYARYSPDHLQGAARSLEL